MPWTPEHREALYIAALVVRGVAPHALWGLRSHAPTKDGSFLSGATALGLKVG
jgi:hypothetical protein